MFIVRLMISMHDVGKRYLTGNHSCVALHDIHIDIAAGELVAVVGKSGSGKTTLINLLTGIDSPSSGTISVCATAIHKMRENDLARWRGKTVGIVFQFFQLLPTLSVIENVMLPMDFCATFPARERRSRALRLLAELRIVDQADKLPSALSGGQQQRAAIARALANDPPLIVADEPTGNLDSGTAHEVMTLFAHLARSGKTVVMATHERDLSRYCARSLTLADGTFLR